MGYYVISNYLPFGRVPKIKTQTTKKERIIMSNEIIVKLEEGLYEEYLEELQKKYYGGINKVLGEPWFHKSDEEMEAEAEKKVKEFMDRNS
jgi:hypothetical protein|tara:strand:+ start:1242 stop:1514 length:273 start_codon:yes stop_codon:yes gene_type:complete